MTQEFEDIFAGIPKELPMPPIAPLPLKQKLLIGCAVVGISSVVLKTAAMINETQQTKGKDRSL